MTAVLFVTTFLCGCHGRGRGFEARRPRHPVQLDLMARPEGPDLAFPFKAQVQCPFYLPQCVA